MTINQAETEGYFAELESWSAGETDDSGGVMQDALDFDDDEDTTWLDALDIDTSADPEEEANTGNPIEKASCSSDSTRGVTPVKHGVSTISNAPSSKTKAGTREFDDYTLVTPWERLVASAEVVIHKWFNMKAESLQLKAEPPREEGVGLCMLTATLTHKLHWRSEPYCLSLYLPHMPPGSPYWPPASKLGEVDLSAAPMPPEFAAGVHKIQRLFRTQHFMVIAPQTLSGRVLDMDEAEMLLKTCSTALYNLGRSSLPSFVPVHDPKRDGYIGSVHGGWPHPSDCSKRVRPEAITRMEADTNTSTRPDPQLLVLSGQRRLLVGKVRASFPASAADKLDVRAKLKFTFRLTAPEPTGCASSDEEDEDTDDEGTLSKVLRSTGMGAPGKKCKPRSYVEEWDEDSPWSPWVSLDDPVESLELDALWDNVPVQSHTEVHAREASCWRLRVVGGNHRSRGSRGGAGGLGGMMRRLVRASVAAAPAESVGVLASHSFWDRLREDPRIPRDYHLQDCMRDIFEAPRLPFSSPNMGTLSKTAICTEHADVYELGNEKQDDQGKTDSDFQNNSKFNFHRFPRRTCPHDCLLARFALHCLVLGNARAVAVLWQRFMREVRFAHWEMMSPLPRMPSQPEAKETPPDLTCCLLHQKLQMLQVCIQRRRAKSQSPALHPQDDAARSATIAASEASSTVDALRAESGGQDSCTALNEASKISRETWAEGDDDVDGWEDMHPVDMLEDGGHVSRFAAAAKEDMLEEWAKVGDGWDLDLGEGGIIGADNTGASASGVVEEGLDAGAEVGIQRDQALADCATAKILCRIEAHGFERYWESVDMEQWGGGFVAPQGVSKSLEGMRLWHAPHTQMNLPLTQDPPYLTEDMLQEQEATLAALNQSPLDADQHQSLECKMLLSDMCAYKAANPGCCLIDFIRWHSPRDWLAVDTTPAHEDGMTQENVNIGEPVSEGKPKGQLSERMTTSSNMWGLLWAKARPVAAKEQKPLLDADGEGEKALHWLDTVPPADLFVQLVAVAYSAISGLLARSPCSTYTSVAHALEDMHSTCSMVVKRPCPFPEEYEAMCQSIESAEHTVALSESLRRRLPDKSQTKLISSLLDACALNQGEINCSPTGLMPEQDISTAEVTDPMEREAIEHLILPGTSGYSDVQNRPGGSASAHTRECALWCESIEEDDFVWLNRMYVRVTTDDVQIATALQGIK